MKAINLNTLEEAEVLKIEGRLHTLRLADGSEDLWDTKDFWTAWRCEGSADYDRALRHKRQASARDEAQAGESL
jgi:hypothetical protein